MAACPVGSPTQVGGGRLELQAAGRRILAAQMHCAVGYGGKAAGGRERIDADLAVKRAVSRERHLAGQLIDGQHAVEGELCKKLPQACETTAANTVAAAPDIALIHPGVMKYFKEIGVAK